jgi:hypothetical protein
MLRVSVGFKLLTGSSFSPIVLHVHVGTKIDEKFDHLELTRPDCRCKSAGEVALVQNLIDLG